AGAAPRRGRWRESASAVLPEAERLDQSFEVLDLLDQPLCRRGRGERPLAGRSDLADDRGQASRHVLLHDRRGSEEADLAVAATENDTIIRAALDIFCCHWTFLS